MVFGTDQLAREFTIHGFDVKHVKSLPEIKAPI